MFYPLSSTPKIPPFASLQCEAQTMNGRTMVAGPASGTVCPQGDADRGGRALEAIEVD